MFQKVLATFGSGGARIDARLLDRAITPGKPLRGEVVLLGGEVDQEINGLAVNLLARVQVPGEREPRVEDLRFGTQQLIGREHIKPGQQVTIPFETQLPWETPISSVFGKPLAGVAIGLQTNLDLANTVTDPADVDAVAIEPLPAQKRVLDAFSHLGFVFREAVLEQGRINGAAQQLPFFQEIRFTPSPRFAPVFTSVAVTFLSTVAQTQVVLEVTKRVRVAEPSLVG
ncbi:sporulation protein [Amycolatopsis sp. H20-H5]|uniref:sporulation protein n=1 Tax=Amycolatopsis sp. H20-H5 TaxID=3046309 RepID=UPI002DBB596E|nr:sporulation protein [Amycolatopsis sp. H20-H5]MEC3974718.1 sporulation protein [Amycolatopsis sp. H20-H5]